MDGARIREEIIQILVNLGDITKAQATLQEHTDRARLTAPLVQRLVELMYSFAMQRDEHAHLQSMAALDLYQKEARHRFAARLKSTPCLCLFDDQYALYKSSREAMEVTACMLQMIRDQHGDPTRELNGMLEKTLQFFAATLESRALPAGDATQALLRQLLPERKDNGVG